MEHRIILHQRSCSTLRTDTASRLIYGQLASFCKSIDHFEGSGRLNSAVVRYTLLVGRPPFQTQDVKAIYDRIKNNNYDFPPNRPISLEAQRLISDILTRDPAERPTLHEIVEYPFFTGGVVPSRIPLSAQDTAPSFSHITRAQSKANLARLRHDSLLDEEVTDIRVDVAPPEMSTTSSRVVISSVEQQKQERDFYKAVQPASPISALLRYVSI